MILEVQFSLSLRKKYCDSLSLNFIFSCGNPIILKLLITFKNNKDKEINGKYNNYIPTLQYLLNIFLILNHTIFFHIYFSSLPYSHVSTTINYSIITLTSLATNFFNLIKQLLTKSISYNIYINT